MRAVSRVMAGMMLTASVVTMPGTGFAQSRPDQKAFFGLYKELVETNTTLSAGSCTQAAAQIGARLKTAGFTDAMNQNLFDGRMQTLPVYIYSQYAYKGIPPEAYVDRAWAAALYAASRAAGLPAEVVHFADDDTLGPIPWDGLARSA